MKDMTTGYPAKIILRFALPLILGNILQQFYNMADSKIVSVYVGTIALAAIGATSVLSNSLISLVNGMTQGFSILIARSFGAKDYVRMRKFIAGDMILTGTLAILLTSLGEVFIIPILKVLSTPKDIMTDAVQYIRIIIAGILFIAIYNMCANLLRAVGDSKHPLYCLLIAIVLNIVLDFLFVGVLKTGIQGAAYATVISQAIAAFLCAGILITKYRELLPHKAEWKPEKGQYPNLLASGFSMGFMGCIVSIGTIVLQGAINSLGTDIVTAHTSGRRVFDILMVILYTVGIAMTTYVSQNMGANRIDRIKQGVRHALIIETIFTTILLIICFAFGSNMVCWIASTSNPNIIKPAILYIQVGIVFFYVAGPLFIYRCSLQGMGSRITPVLSSVIEMLLKIASAAFLVPRLAYLGVALTEPISWIVMTIYLAIIYYITLAKCMRKHTEDHNHIS